jgi:hypothetical protein
MMRKYAQILVHQGMRHELKPFHSSGSSCTFLCTGLRLAAATKSSPASDFLRPNIVSWTTQRSKNEGGNFNPKDLPSPDIMSSAIGRLPEVMYLVETPWLRSGWDMSSFNLAFKTAIFASVCFFRCFDGLLSSADSLDQLVSVIIFVAFA